MQPRVSRKLHDRVEGLPAAVRDIAWKGQRRMCRRCHRLAAAGKPEVVVTTAIAREMAGFIWAIARTEAADPARPAARAAWKDAHPSGPPMRKAWGGTRRGSDEASRV
nr:hypothetical protein [Poseidonocella sp. HB161398]